MSLTKYKAGDVVDLTGVPATFNMGYSRTILKGKYELVEFHPYEPSAYVQSPCWDVLPVDFISEPNWENEILDVDDYDLFEHLEPEVAQRFAALEDEAAIELERFDDVA